MATLNAKGSFASLTANDVTQSLPDGILLTFVSDPS